MLDGGVLTTGPLVRQSGTGTLNFDGGTLRAAANSATFLQGLTAATVRAGGATVDTSGRNITIAQPLIHDASAAAIDGGLTKLGAGTLTLTGSNTYTGGTTINNGVLATTGTGTLGSGPLVINGNGGAISVVNLAKNQAVNSLSGATSAGGSAQINVGAGTTLTVNQSLATSFAGSVSLASGAMSGTGGGFVKMSGGTLEIGGGMALGNNSSLAVNAGTLRFNVNSGSPNVGTGVTANISNSGVLELAGSVSTLGGTPPANRVVITNSSNAVAGLLVSAGNQQVGGIGGTGNTQVNGDSELTANHIIQSSLIIGGAATSPGLVTIDASDVAGNPLIGGFADSLTPTSSFGITDGSGDKISPTAGDGHFAATPPSTSGGFNPTGASAVPEPTGLILFTVAGLAVGAAAVCRRLNDQT
jgi:fibronectin-binding autotransporter adhesin